MRGQAESFQNGSESKERERFGGERCDSMVGSEGVGDVAGEGEEDEGVEGGEREGCGDGLRSWGRVGQPRVKKGLPKGQENGQNNILPWPPSSLRSPSAPRPDSPLACSRQCSRERATGTQSTIQPSAHSAPRDSPSRTGSRTGS